MRQGWFEGFFYLTQIIKDELHVPETDNFGIIFQKKEMDQPV